MLGARERNEGDDLNVSCRERFRWDEYNVRNVCLPLAAITRFIPEPVEGV